MLGQAHHFRLYAPENTGKESQRNGKFDPQESQTNVRQNADKKHEQELTPDPTAQFFFELVDKCFGTGFTAVATEKKQQVLV
jgi:hypothetical protein